MDQKVVEMDNDGMQDPLSDLVEVRLTRSNSRKHAYDCNTEHVAKDTPMSRRTHICILRIYFYSLQLQSLEALPCSATCGSRETFVCRYGFTSPASSAVTRVRSHYAA